MQTESLKIKSCFSWRRGWALTASLMTAGFELRGLLSKRKGLYDIDAKDISDLGPRYWVSIAKGEKNDQHMSEKYQLTVQYSI